jgi:formylglycine-generating enzyme required for sulfatase activity
VQEGACERPTEGSSFGNSQFEEYPVTGVTWSQARTYCKWARRRLPSEAEWEKAARGQDGWTYPWGNNEPNGNLLNYCDINCNDTLKDNRSNDRFAQAAPAGSYPAGASPYGALDMAGNVWEWVEDWYNDAFYTLSPGQNPSGPSFGSFRVVRGSSWKSPLLDIRITMRLYYSPNTFLESLGFRCAQ